MSDNDKNQDDLELEGDDFLEEDFDDLDDVDDLEIDEADIGDLDDESWDEFDSDLDEGAPASSTLTPPKKSFFVQHFNAIVITIAVIGGGGFIFSQLSKPPAETVSTLAPVMAEAMQESAPALPDMPALATPDTDTNAADSPISDMAAALPDLVDAAEDEISIDDILMPDQPPAAAPDELEALPELEFVLNDDEKNTDEGALTPLPDLAGDTLDDLPELELELDLEPAEDNIPDQPPEDMLAESESVSEESGMLADSPVVDFTEDESADIVMSDEPSDNTAPDDDDMPELSMDEPVIQEPVTNEAQLRILELESEKQVLKNKVQAGDIQVSDLEATVKRLEQKLALAQEENTKLQKDIKAAQKEAAATPTPAPASKPESVKKIAPPPPKAPVKKPASRPAQKTSSSKSISNQWVMRSAQPGRAVVSNKETYDLRSIAVGDSLPGLGKITAIELQNGLWVVRGTKGSISQ